MIVATGGQASHCAAYEYGSSDLVLNQLDLEKQLANPDEAIKKLKSVVMIQCAGSREEPRNYCSRICCVKALKNAIRLKEIAPRADISIWYRDIMTCGENEKMYTRARQAGVLFVPFDLDSKPRVSLLDHRPVVEGFDSVLQETLSLQPDLLVLSTGISPHAVDVKIQGVLLETTQDGFLKEADSKWRPVDSGREGVFICGLARNPVNAKEAMVEGEAAAQRALRILFQNRLGPQRIAARVRPSLCSLCELCIESCVYGARRFDPESHRIVVDPAACQGCGVCAAVCPNSATVIGDFEDNGIMDAIEASLD
jgi:heterodisulfide reductase subunit A